MIYTVAAKDMRLIKGPRPPTWLDVDCLAPLDLDLLDDMTNNQRLFPVGLRTSCDHDWWIDDCYRGRAADYLFLAGAEVRHLGEIIWDHRPYASGRWNELYDEATIDTWTRRLRRRQPA